MTYHPYTSAELDKLFKIDEQFNTLDNILSIILAWREHDPLRYERLYFAASIDLESHIYQVAQIPGAVLEAEAIVKQVEDKNV